MEDKEQVQKTAAELRQGIKNRAERQRLVELFKDTVKELAKDAEWYEACNASGLAEQCRYCERGVLDIIELVQSECDTPDDVDDMLDSFKNDAFDTFKFMRSGVLRAFGGACNGAVHRILRPYSSRRAE